MKKLISACMVVMFSVLVACATGGGNPAVGAWDIEMNTPVGAMPAVLIINEDGTGSMSAEGLGDAPITGIDVAGNVVTFSADLDAQGQALTLNFSGVVEADSLTGEFGSDFGSFEVTGTRQ